ncbi:MAG: hypothetical protein ACUVX9_12110, partial [Anaerolineae bacterium]
PQVGAPIAAASRCLSVDYQPLPPQSETEQRLIGLSAIAEGDLDTSAAQMALQQLGNIMNVAPGQRPAVAKAVFAARALVRAEQRVMAASREGARPAPCALALTVWRWGQVALAFVAAELFAQTGLRIRGLAQEGLLLPVTVAGPIIGYVPDREAMMLGGYEVDDAWRFYRQIAPFVPQAEDSIVMAIGDLYTQVYDA